MSIEDERVVRLRIGAGSFATAFVVGGAPIAYKEVADASRAHELLDEYHSLVRIHATCNTDSFFEIPRALAFNDPDRGQFLNSPRDPSARRRSGRPATASSMFSPFSRATYAMDRVFHLPLAARYLIRDTYFSAGMDGPSLCRLYFGKDYTDAPPPRFFNSHNFPLDRHRYTGLAADFPALEDVDDIARGMGEMLARVHFIAALDARDVEFVLGGDGGAGFTYFMIDFNQVRPWSKGEHPVEPLVQAFFANDPYYPRPRSDDGLYRAFRDGYLHELRSEDVPIGEAFFSALEKEQGLRDLRAQVTL